MVECKNCAHLKFIDGDNYLGCEKGLLRIDGGCSNYKNENDMKDLIKSWKFWLIVAAVVLAIVAVVLYFVSPKFCYAASGLLIGALAGFIAGYFVSKKGVNHE